MERLLKMQVRLVYWDGEQQFDRLFDVLPKTSVQEAIQQSGIQEAFPSLKFQMVQFAIFGRCVAKDCLLQEGDRIEILRPLRKQTSHSRQMNEAGKLKAGQ